MCDDRTTLVAGKIEAGVWVVVTGPRFNGRKGKVVRLWNDGTTATVRGDFGTYANRGRVERDFRLEHLSLYAEDMDSSFPGEYH